MSSKKDLFGGFRKAKPAPKAAAAAGGADFAPPKEEQAGAENEASPAVANTVDGGVAASAGTPSTAGDVSGAEAPSAGAEASGARGGKKGRKMRFPKAKAKVAVIAPQEASEEDSLPLNVHVDFYRGVSKEREAEAIARAFVEKNYEAPNASYVFVKKWRDGCAVEMQEGGGEAYLPEILERLDADDDAIVVAGMSNRYLQVRLDPDTQMLECFHLTNNQSPPAEAIEVLPSEAMTPFDKRGSKVFVAGVGLLSASLIALVFSVGAFFIDTEAWALPYLQQTRVKDLPSAQTESIERVLASADCISKMEFRNGTWNILPGWDNGVGECSSTQPVVAAPSGVPDGSVELDPEIAPGPPAPGEVMPLAGQPDVLPPQL